MPKQKRVHARSLGSTSDVHAKNVRDSVRIWEAELKKLERLIKNDDCDRAITSYGQVNYIDGYASAQAQGAKRAELYKGVTNLGNKTKGLKHALVRQCIKEDIII